MDIEGFGFPMPCRFVVKNISFSKCEDRQFGISVQTGHEKAFLEKALNGGEKAILCIVAVYENRNDAENC